MAKRRRKDRNRTYTYVKGATKPIIRFRFKVVFFIFLIMISIFFVIYMTGVHFGDDDEGSYTVTWQEHTEETTETNKKVTEESAEKNNDETKINSEAEEEYKKIVNPVPESPVMSQTYFGKCMFVGDSITVGLSDYQLVPMKNVLAEIGMNIEKINNETMQTAFGDTTALDALTQASPENVYIMLGSNGIAWLTVDNMISEYEKFAKSVQTALPEAKIYIQSIPPVTPAKANEEYPIFNSTIDEYNSKLLEMANANGYYYVDVHSALENTEGALPDGDAAEDGMHFNKSTYDKMIQYILSHVAQ